jgi:hypothetical protein
VLYGKLKLSVCIILVPLPFFVTIISIFCVLLYGRKSPYLLHNIFESLHNKKFHMPIYDLGAYAIGFLMSSVAQI